MWAITFWGGAFVFFLPRKELIRSEIGLHRTVLIFVEKKGENGQGHPGPRPSAEKLSLQTGSPGLG